MINQLCAGRACDAMAAGLEHHAGWLVQADNAGIIVSLISRFAGRNHPGSGCSRWSQLLEGLLGSSHLLPNLASKNQLIASCIVPRGRPGPLMYDHSVRHEQDTVPAKLSTLSLLRNLPSKWHMYQIHCPKLMQAKRRGRQTVEHALAC